MSLAPLETADRSATGNAIRHDWTRAEVRALTGQNGVPVLFREGGGVIAGSARIAAWAAAHPAPGGLRDEQAPRPITGSGAFGTEGGG